MYSVFPKCRRKLQVNAFVAIESRGNPQYLPPKAARCYAPQETDCRGHKCPRNDAFFCGRLPRVLRTLAMTTKVLHFAFCILHLQLHAIPHPPPSGAPSPRGKALTHDPRGKALTHDPRGKAFRPYFCFGIVMVRTIWSSVSRRSEMAEMPAP